ncbi:MAG: aldo/keto reductase [Spirochaetes bacterium]|uniref:Aldo/keto reductase n=1 Tax=Candidatus Ornithospirochaeta stercoripullorum TaxID=2840899 RepID=A0A9D9E4Z4_9SPIO|nr:aldo/keto reductase [Candidatus Ornithospirochaeta stercoripullorum]
MKIIDSECAMGLWNLSESSFHQRIPARDGKNLIKAAYRKGIRLFDTAYSYNEADSLLYSAMKEIRAKDFAVVSKIMPVPSLRKKAETSLKRLGIEHFKILLLHWPCSEPLFSESLEELVKLKDEGKTEAIGVSNLPFHMLQESIKRFPLEYHERPLSLLWNKDWEKERMLNIKTIAYSPLGMGLLSGKYRNLEDIPDQRRTLPSLSAQSCHKLFEAIDGDKAKALSWVYSQHPWCVVSGFHHIIELEILSSIYALESSEEEKLTQLADAISDETAYDNIFAHNWRKD